MIHRIFPFAQSGFEQTVVFRTDTVCQTSCIAKRNLFIPAFFPSRFLAFEREETAQRYIQVGQRHRNGRVTHGLCDIGYLQVNPSVNYTERWYTRKVNQQYNEETRRLEALPGDTINGFYRVSNYSASLSLSTKLYGMYKPLFMKKKEIQIRHVFTPQVSLSGAPGFSKYWEEYTDYNGDTQYYSPFTGQPYGVPSREGSGTVSFSIANNLEMKYYDENPNHFFQVSLLKV